MDCNSIAKQLRQYSQDLIAYKMGAEFADACNDAADAIEQLSAELERATKERCKFQELTHSQRNGLEQLRAELEQVKREKDAEEKDLLTHTDYCEVCVHNGEADGCDCDCEERKSVCPCYSCIKGSNFVWRGPQKEEIYNDIG